MVGDLGVRAPCRSLSAVGDEAEAIARRVSVVGGGIGCGPVGR